MSPLLVVFLILFKTSLVAQDTTSRPLWNKAGTFALHGRARLDALEELAKTLRDVDPDSSVVISRILMAEARSARDTLMIGSAFRNLAISEFFRTGDAEATIPTLDSALHYFRTGSDSSYAQGMGRAYSNKAYMHIALRRYDTAIENCHFSLPYLKKSDDLNSMLNVYNDLGQSYKAHGRTDSAVYYFEMLIDLAQQLDQERQVCWGYNNLSMVHAGIGLLPEALDNAYRALNIFEKIGTEIEVVNSLYVLRDIKVMLGEYDGALELLDRAMDLCMKIGDTTCIASTYGAIGSTMLEMGHLDSAMATLERSLAMAHRADPSAAASTHELSMLSKTYRLMGRTKDALAILEQLHSEAQELSILEDEVWILQEKGLVLMQTGQYDKASNCCEESLRKSETAGLRPSQQGALECLYQIHKKRGNGMKALVYLEKANDLKSSIFSEKAQRQAAQRDFQRVHEKQKLQDSLRHVNELLEMEHARTVATLRADQNGDRAMATGIGAMLLLGGGSASYFVDRKRRKERFEKEAATLETQALRSQMNPHFIFNALNSINAFVQRNDQDSASSYLSKFARVMRLVLENSRHAEVPLNDDLEALRGYMDLERMRSNKKFDFTINVDPSLDPEEVLVPPLVVQPFVENAIWHGMAGIDADGSIALSIKRKGDQLIWTIEDNGAGRSAKKPVVTDHEVKKTSLGTAITRARLDLVQKQHGGKAGFHYTDLERGTRVQVEMPLLLN